MKEYIERDAAIELGKKQSCAGIIDGGDFCNISANMLRKIPAADVVEGKAYRDLLGAAKKMHLWIFKNTADEMSAYDECGLTDEMNALLGYGGRYEITVRGGADDGKAD